MKKLGSTVAFLAATSLNAADGNTEKSFKLKGQVRLDHKFVETKTDTSTSKSGGFSLKRARIGFEGSTSKELSYRFKIDFDRAHNADSGATGSSDGVSKILKEGKVMYAFAENFALEFGRLEVNTMSVEGFYSSMDLYSESEQLIKRKPGSANGAALVANIAEQNLVLQVVNSPGYDLTGEKNYSVEDDDMTVTFQWRGKFGALQPHVTAANIARHDYDAKTKIKSSRYNAQMYGAGGTFVVDDLTLELEGDQYSNPAYKKNSEVDVSTGKASVVTWIGSARYNVQPLLTTVILKASQDNEKFSDDAAKDSIRTTKYNAALEFRPILPQQLRFHASYENAASLTAKEGKSDQKKTTNTYLVGAAASI